MPAVAILLFVWAGFLILLGGANTNLVAQGRQIFSTTFFGIIIMLSAWLITNTLIKSIGSNYDKADNWWQFECVETVPTTGTPTPTPTPTGTPTPSPTSTGDLCSQPAQLAASNNVPYPRKNSPELDQLISCVNSRIGGLIDQNQIFTYEKTNDLCNYTRGQQTCGSCVHSAFSCHYGGRDGTQGSLAVDFNAKNGNETTLFNELKKLESTCQFGYILFENTHTHVSTKSCSGN